MLIFLGSSQELLYVFGNLFSLPYDVLRAGKARAWGCMGLCCVCS